MDKCKEWGTNWHTSKQFSTLKLAGSRREGATNVAEYISLGSVPTYDWRGVAWFLPTAVMTVLGKEVEVKGHKHLCPLFAGRGRGPGQEQTASSSCSEIEEACAAFP